MSTIFKDGARNFLHTAPSPVMYVVTWCIFSGDYIFARNIQFSRCTQNNSLNENGSCHINSYSASHDNWCTGTLWNRVITAQCEGMGEVWSARCELKILPPCPSIRALCYSNCQRTTQSHQQSKGYRPRARNRNPPPPREFCRPYFFDSLDPSQQKFTCLPSWKLHVSIWQS